MYTRLLFGVNCASDYFAKKFATLLSDIPNVVIHVDDVLIYAKSVEEHDKTLKIVLERLTNEGVTLNREKCAFAAREVNFLGHKISERGIDVLPERVSAIINFPDPNNKESLMQFLGAVNYIGKYIPNKSKILEPLNSLLKDNIHFVWLEPQKRAFKEVKQYIQRAPTLAHYDYSKNIVVQADASSFGLGAALMQEDQNKVRETVAYASRTLTTCEKKYSQIEKEALALAFAAERFKEYVQGIDFTLETDHKPLLQILQTKPLDELTPRLQRIRMRLLRYSFKVVYVPGKQLVLADSLSRNPLERDRDEGNELSNEIESYVQFIVGNIPASKNLMDKISEEQQCDYICSKLKDYCLSKWPSKSQLPEGLLPYFQLKDYISYGDGFLLYNTRLIIPPSLQLEIISRIHEGHLGINKCRDRAKQSVWWLGLSSQLRHLVENCPNCIQERKNISQPFVKENFPDRPWQKIALDLFKVNKWYLIATDYYSRFFEICSLKTMSEHEIIDKCKNLFARFGVPEIVRSDCGTQFSSAFNRFANGYDFKHITSSPKFSQSNGAAEAAVKIAKNIIKKCDDVNLGLLSYRTTPLENGYSPAELMFSRKIRSRVPVLPKNLGTFANHEQVTASENKRKSDQELMYNRRHRAKKLSELSINDRVWIVDMRAYGEFINIDNNPNSFVIKTERGSVVRRNRWHLIPAPFKRSLESINNDTPDVPEDAPSNTPPNTTRDPAPYNPDAAEDDNQQTNQPEELPERAQEPPDTDGGTQQEERNITGPPEPRRSTRRRNPPVRFGDPVTRD
ncbi:PREDICTED: uncharacterized protein K02A2.6-like [Vollenhovia emeryi]|uniref:uncharacterized protein K02A2.6-like n=1 Tax=Vollenhovia emeryi TaxID=411798 RepID=UPI0005F567C1|nr:PREDICTED: uncharacterized protein K02A2.6-like [Vollenhovia emeryi]